MRPGTLRPRFDLTVGGRLAHNKQEADLRSRSDSSAELGRVRPPTHRKPSSLIRSRPDYEVNDHASIYARVATGYRPGGPNVIPVGSPPGIPTTYDADRLTNWELG